MTDCAKIEELISAMVDGELDERSEKAVREHIEGCPSCRAMYEAFTFVSGKMADALCDAPDGLKDSVMAEIRAQTPERKKRGLLVRLRPYMSAAACLVVLVGVAAAARSFSGGLSAGGDAAAESNSSSAPAAYDTSAASSSNTGDADTGSTIESYDFVYGEESDSMPGDAEGAADNAAEGSKTANDRPQGVSEENSVQDSSRAGEGKCAGTVTAILPGEIGLLPDEEGDMLRASEQIFRLAEGVAIPDGAEVGSRVTVEFVFAEGEELPTALSITLVE